MSGEALQRFDSGTERRDFGSVRKNARHNEDISEARGDPRSESREGGACSPNKYGSDTGRKTSPSTS